MPPRVHRSANGAPLVGTFIFGRYPPRAQRCYATISAITPAASHEQTTNSPPPLQLYPATQPPSYKPPQFRKSQLLRQYASLLRASPLLLIFQHNNLKASEWIGIRRELSAALRKVDELRAADGHSDGLADIIKLQIVSTGMFAVAVKVVDFFKPGLHKSSPTVPPANDPSASSSADLHAQQPVLTHALSKEAYEAVRYSKRKHALRPLLSGPLAILSFPSVEPQYLKAALQILSPHAPAFPAPTRKANPGYHDSAVQTGLQKVMLLGARVEGRTFDIDKVGWMGGIEGGFEGLRGHLVQVLQGAASGVAGTLEAPSKNLYLTVEGRRMMMEDNAKQTKSAGEKKVEEGA